MKPASGLRAGFIGLGSIGKPMAQRLILGGLDTMVFDIAAPAVEELVTAGARRAHSPREVAAATDIVGVCVRDDGDVRDVMLGPDGILAGAAPGLVVSIHSTILPRTVCETAAIAAAQGVAVIDACVTGGKAGAEQGRLTYMVGGDAAHLERCRPMFATAAEKIVHTGPLGSGAATKLCNNLMTYLGFLAAFEATLLARGAGLSQDAFEQVTRANGNLTDQMHSFLSVYRMSAAQRREPNVQEMLRSYTTLAEKDLAVTLAFAREHGIALPGTGLCSQLMARVYGVNDENRR